jgi:hypothetical protein
MCSPRRNQECKKWEETHVARAFLPAKGEQRKKSKEQDRELHDAKHGTK